MAREESVVAVADRPQLPSVLELLKPVTWFPPMWAFLCGIVSSGVAYSAHWGDIVLGILLAGPFICGASQAINDWFDREVDAINQPERPIPSGRVPGSWGLYIGVLWALIGLGVAYVLGPWVFAATLVGLFLAWVYSAPPIRLKKNGWWGNAAVGISYEGLPWFAAAAAMTAAFPDWRILCVALLYSIGAHGIMTLNDFKSVQGDLRTGVGSLPARLGVERAAWVACAVMSGAQLVVIGLLFGWNRPWHAAGVAALLIAQFALMWRLIEKPRERDYWYNATGVPLFVLGMMVTALAVRSLVNPG